MKKDLDFDALMEKGDLLPISKWLNEHIHQYGSLYDPSVLLEKATGEPFNPAYYVEHLKAVIADLVK